MKNWRYRDVPTEPTHTLSDEEIYVMDASRPHTHTRGCYPPALLLCPPVPRRSCAILKEKLRRIITLLAFHSIPSIFLSKWGCTMHHISIDAAMHPCAVVTLQDMQCGSKCENELKHTMLQLFLLVDTKRKLTRFSVSMTNLQDKSVYLLSLMFYHPPHRLSMHFNIRLTLMLKNGRLDTFHMRRHIPWLAVAEWTYMLCLCGHLKLEVWGRPNTA